MKILFFCWADEMKVELAYWSKYFELYTDHFFIMPIIRDKDKISYQDTISYIRKIGRNTEVEPIYIRSEDTSFKNLLNPTILLNDFLAIFRSLSKLRPDLVICYYITHAYPLALFKKYFHFSLCSVAMGSDINLENSLLQRIIKNFVFQNCNNIFAASWGLKEKIEAQNGFPVIVTPSSTDTSFFRPLESKVQLRKKWKIENRKNVLITVCRLDKNKAVNTLIESIKELNSDSNLLLVVGDGPERGTLESLAENLDIKEQVKFLGFKNRSDLLELYNVADIFVLASFAEGLPRVLIEAMSCGCLPIVTNVGSIGVVVSNGINGFTVEPGKPSLFCKIITQISTLSGKEISLMQKRAREAVIEQFESRNVLNLMLSSIKNSSKISNLNEI
jgi:glycosyltransferase involved in cell wall biosynthesis